MPGICGVKGAMKMRKNYMVTIEVDYDMTWGYKIESYVYAIDKENDRFLVYDQEKRQFQWYPFSEAKLID